ncbi:MAG: serine/threonine protein kinase [Bacilli bacterium]|nr:serine/threonine protein kinase [Bacilli bacterium]
MEKIVVDERYILQSKIGYGGYATVFLAFDKILSQLVAIKVLKCDINENKKAYDMFKQEAMTLASLSNPNIVKVYSSGIYENNPYLVMDYVRGRSLKDIIYSNGYLLVDEIVSYMQQIISGLEACHNNQIVHRDIKPQNIIKKADGLLVLLDFGTAVIEDVDKNIYKEDGSVIIGTVQYMAPELVHNPRGSMQTDIYALGVTMFEMFTGTYPFMAEDKKDIVRMHINNPFPSIRKINANVPIEFERIINKCCQKNPKKRYKNVNELRLDILIAYEKYKNPSTSKFGFLKRIFKK